MIRFNCDYQEGAHPRILQKLMDTNYVQTPGYGEDEFCAEAAKIIREKCAAPKADVHFLVGGTQTNLIFMSAALRSHQGCISVATGHVAVHESGAIEATGHKVITLPGRDGKLIAGEVSSVNDDKTDNYFAEPVSRFADIEEDEAPLHPLCNEYDKL